MRYRDHRGGLKESLETQQEVNSVEEIKEHLNKSYEPLGKTVEEIKFEYGRFDERTGWDTYYVMMRFKGQEKFSVAGMSDGEFK